MRNGLKMGNTEIVDTTVHDGLTDAFNKIHMGITGEYTVLQSLTFRDYRPKLCRLLVSIGTLRLFNTG